MNKETEADLKYLRGRGTSLGGMRPKCTILDEDGHLAIGKFPSVKDDRSVTRGEVEVCAAILNWKAIAKSAPVGMSSDDLDAFAPALENEQMGVAMRLLAQ